jgi:hypothetical protein
VQGEQRKVLVEVHLSVEQPLLAVLREQILVLQTLLNMGLIVMELAEVLDHKMGLEQLLQMADMVQVEVVRVSTELQEETVKVVQES